MQNGLGKIQNVVLIGGTSEIGTEIVKHLPISADARLLLVGRRDIESHSLQNLYSRVEFVELDLLSSFEAGIFVTSVFEDSDIDVVVFAAGMMGFQKDLAFDLKVRAVLNVNAEAQIRLLSSFAERMKMQKHGRILVVSSVAAIRPRLSNYFYGSSKAAIDFFARGLSKDMKQYGVGVSVLRPGFVRTAMTVDLKEAPFAANPVDVGRVGAQGLFSSIDVIYAPGILRYVMFVLGLLPLAILNKLESKLTS
jgi:decaprenylphospho-beta-D-erythro-pentofuranosid-2-ulose 2-reductase